MKTTAMVLAVMLVVLLVSTTAMAEVYVVKGGDTPSRIAKRFHIATSEIMRIAKISDPRKLRVGTKLDINKIAKKHLDKIEKGEVFQGKKVRSAYPRVEVPQNYRNGAPNMTAANPVNTNLVVDQDVAAAAANSASQAETERNLASAREQGMTASADNKFVPETGSKMPSRPFVLGKSFNEVALTVGGGKNISSPAYFGYSMLEGMHWREQKDAGRNLGLGALALVDGWEDGRGKYSSNALSLMGQLGWYEIIGKKEDTHILVKPRIGAKIHLDDTKDKVNLVVGLYGEVDHKTSPANRIGVSVDGMYEFKKDKDGYAVGRLFYEHTLDNKMRLMVGAGPVVHFSGDSTNKGISPAISLRIPFDRNNALTMGIIGDFTGGERNSVGAFATYAWDDIRYKERNKK